MTWWINFEVNVKGTFLSSKAFLTLLLKMPPSSVSRQIIITTSIGTHIVSPRLSTYNTTKLAICRYTEFIAADYAEQGLNAISLHPSGVTTELC
jgi:NAD(P)-dependent dehydrogenase (short-subunit alcohol dehydrogenase family)